MIALVRDHRAINVLAKFENDPWKFTNVRALTVIFHVRSWKMRKKIRQNFFLAIMTKPVPNLVTLAWKMSSGRSKEAGSLNGRLCAYLMSRTSMIELVWDLRAINVLAKFENDPWKIVDVRVLTGLVCPAACPLGRRQYPGALKGCGQGWGEYQIYEYEYKYEYL